MDEDLAFQLNLNFDDGPAHRKLPWKERKVLQVCFLAGLWGLWGERGGAVGAWDSEEEERARERRRRAEPLLSPLGLLPPQPGGAPQVGRQARGRTEWQARGRARRAAGAGCGSRGAA
jgi:hypothetical protein